jgi:hypothetical protein
MARYVALYSVEDESFLISWCVCCVQAPGYFSIISKPMDLQTMKQKLLGGEYGSWDVFKADLDLMFTNAKTYNPITHPVWKTVSNFWGYSSVLYAYMQEGPDM